MNLLTKLFRLPTPKEIGWDEYLPIRDLEGPEEKNTWEDYFELCQKRWPIRYFLNEQLPQWTWHPIKRAYKHIAYWLRCHTYNRYHILDLRQPKLRNGQPNQDHYSWGWNDRDRLMLLAVFNLLVLFVEEEDRYCPEEADIEKERFNNGEQYAAALKQQREEMLEVKALYQYWTVERNQQALAVKKSLDEWYQNHRQGIRTNPLNDQHRQLEKEFEVKEDEMLMRVMKVRRILWS